MTNSGLWDVTETAGFLARLMTYPGDVIVVLSRSTTEYSRAHTDSKLETFVPKRFSRKWLIKLTGCKKERQASGLTMGFSGFSARTRSNTSRLSGDGVSSDVSRLNRHLGGICVRGKENVSFALSSTYKFSSLIVIHSLLW